MNFYIVLMVLGPLVVGLIAEAIDRHEAALSAFDPGRCPECGKALKVRTNTENGSRFVGCTGYPDCRYTRPLPAYIEMLESGAEQLPGF